MITNIFKNKDQAWLDRKQETLILIKNFQQKYSQLSEVELKDVAIELKSNGLQCLDIEKLIPESFALFAEVSRRKLNIYPYEVQLLGALALIDGYIAEMKTGEGKTYVAPIAAYTRALTGSQVHIITANEYLVKRDANLLTPVFDFLDISLGWMSNDMKRQAKKECYKKDVIYLTASDAGFDYLKDNICTSESELLQTRGLDCVIIDEADSILIDEASTPLVINSPGNIDSIEIYKRSYEIAKKLIPQVDFNIDEKRRQAYLTDEGYQAIETIQKEKESFSDSDYLYGKEHLQEIAIISTCLRAMYIFKADVDYIVRQGKVMIISEKTGRAQPGRRWSKGLHQCIEAKEGVDIQPESVRSASITIQNLFNLYKSKCGMTGTAKTEEAELEEIYNLGVIQIPTNKDNQRTYLIDQFFFTKEEKNLAIAEEIEQVYKNSDQPMLIGTASLEYSEQLSAILSEKGIPHNTLNAKNHAQEAEIIAQAGMPKTVTIATNMAGRGTDIMLGGNINKALSLLEDNPRAQANLVQEYENNRAKVIAAGGLYVIGAERNTAKRIDNQLIGRCARQGDPGKSVFYNSLEDKCLLISGREEVRDQIVSRFKGYPALLRQSPLAQFFVDSAQKNLEEQSFSSRKREQEFDSIVNEQRKTFYLLRREILLAKKEQYISWIQSLLQTEIYNIYKNIIENVDNEETDINPSLSSELYNKLHLLTPEHISQANIQAFLLQIKEQKESLYELSVVSQPYWKLERSKLLEDLQNFWQQHLQVIEWIRQSVAYRGYSQKDPLEEFRFEIYLSFCKFMNELDVKIVHVCNSFDEAVPAHLKLKQDE